MLDVEFNKILSDAGIPTTQAELDAQWKADVVASGSTINNDNAYSPFWRAITALITKPALWLIQFMISTALPNSFVKYATGTFLELLADGVNLSRKSAISATGMITFTRGNVGTAVTIPINTIIQTATLNGKIYQLKTTSEAAFQAGLTTLDVPVTAVEVGAAFNLATGYYAVLPVPIANITAVTNGENWLTVPGANQETDDALRARVRNQFGTASDFHTDSVYRSLIAEFPGVAVDAIWFVHDAPRGPGTADAYVLFDFAAPVVTYLADINGFITDDGHHGHGDDLQVLQMPEQTQTLAVTVWHEDFLSAAEISQLQSDVDTFIKAAFRENTSYSPTLTYPYARFSFSRLAQEIHREFSSVHSVDFSLADIVSALWIPRLTSLTITMEVTE
tara:strand:+ start:94253 stop:95428 length:1176 start_codon:yes stop_codon:yes gene_type:complete